MNKSEFMEELSAQLSQIDAHERSEAIAFYNEYFEDAGIENEQAVIEELGSPAQVAAQIKADAAVKETQAGSTPVKKGIYAIAVVILGICSLPITFPLLIVALAAVFTILVLAATFVFVLVVLVGAGFFTGIVLLAEGIGVLFAVPSAGIFCIGFGLVVLGFSMLSAIIVFVVACEIVNGLVKLVNYIRVKVQKKHAKNKIKS